MINSKRLIMMAVAASMVLPNSLMAFSPILATDSGTTTGTSEETPQTPENPDDGTGADQEESKIKEVSNEEDLIAAAKTGGSYRLSANITLNAKLVVDAPDPLVIDLNGYDITSNKDVNQTIWLMKDTSLELTGKGNIISTVSKLNDAGKPVSGNIILIAGENVHLTVGPGITIEWEKPATEPEGNVRTLYGIAVFGGTSNGATPGKNAVVNVTGATISSSCGISVAGDLPDNEPATVNLTNVIIDSKGVDGIGIYQAGASTFNLKDCTISSDTCGIEIRSGNLNVSGGTITKTNVPDQELILFYNKAAGTSTQNAAISVAQHVKQEINKDRKINVNLVNTTVTGGVVGLFIADPLTQADSSKKDANISINVANSTLTGDTAPVGYTKDTLSFNLIDSGFTMDRAVNQIKKFEKDSTSSSNALKVCETEPMTKPYTIINTDSTGAQTPTTTVALSKDDIPSDAIDSNNLVKEDKKADIENLLKAEANKPENQGTLNPIDPESGEPSSTATPLNYTYTVAISGAALPNPDGTYSFPATLKAKLDKTKGSLIRLLIPINSDQLETASFHELETSEATNGEFTDEYFALDIELSKILDNQDQIDSKNLQEILAKIPQLEGRIDSEANFIFPQFELTKEYDVDDLITPITLKGEKKQVTNYNPGSPHSKPKPKPEEPMTPVATPTPMYRLYNRLTGEHLFTIDKNERDNLLTSDTWKDEGQGWIAPSESAYPVYRLLNPNTTDHHYTMDKNEFDTLPSYGWVAEGVAFFSADKDNPENVILHRLYNSNEMGAGSHHYTADTNERDTLVGLGWTYEGLAWAGLPETK